jgi:hypothetical protein
MGWLMLLARAEQTLEEVVARADMILQYLTMVPKIPFNHSTKNRIFPTSIKARMQNSSLSSILTYAEGW